MSRPSLPARQRGVALITAVLIVALAAIAATAIALSGDAALHRAAILQETERAWWYADGVQSWVRSILERDAEETEFDALTEQWAQPIDYLPLEEGFVSGQIIDQQGLFNLNNLGDSDAEDRQRHAEQFERLIGQLGDVDPFIGKQLAPAIIDWIDQDLDPTPYDGAEDDEYLRHDVPYRTANRLFSSVSELMLVRGMTPELYRALAPYLTALPYVGTPINVNTAPEPVLRALVVEPSAEFEAFLRDRFEEPAEGIGDLTSSGAFGARDAPSDDLSVSSNYFLLNAETTVGNSRVALFSLFLRPSGSPPVLLVQSTAPL